VSGQAPQPPAPSGPARPRPGSGGAPGADGLRILLVSQFWPGPADPDYGVFVAQVAEELERRGHAVAVAATDRRGAGRAGDARLLRAAVARAVRWRPDVVFAHFLVPAGLAATLAALPLRTPLVAMAHGQDVRNARSSAAIRLATRLVVGRAHTVIFNSAFLRDGLPLRPHRAEVIDCGVDLERFGATGGVAAPAAGGPTDADAARAAARAAVGLADAEAPIFLFAGSLIERKNVVRLRDAFEALGRGTLVVLGDGPLRPALAGRPRIRLAGRVAHDAVPRWMAAADVVCLPSLEEPLGQVLLEALAAGRSVVATRNGGPAEFVTEQAGALVDPLDVASIRAGLERAAALPSPNPAARAAAEPHDLRRQVARMERVLRAAAASRR
jgi:glycosyltransferase involved in cell wall biosynthesis